MKLDIQSPEDVKLMVDTFYEKVNADELLSKVFNEDTQVDWNAHLPKMYKFWSTQLIGTGDYHGRPFPPHTELKINQDHFERWLQLFLTNIDEYFEGTNVEIAKKKAQNIATIFQYKLGLIT